MFSLEDLVEGEEEADCVDPGQSQVELTSVPEPANAPITASQEPDSESRGPAVDVTAEGGES